MNLQPIARIQSPFHEKFGTPRQPSLVPSVRATIVFEPPFRDPAFVRGLSDFEYIWLLFSFSLNRPVSPRPTVRPPRLGGNERVGVFATRSPYRPNPIGLSSVRLVDVDYTSSSGPLLHVAGVDLVNDTPIFDIKPYLPYSDSHPDAKTGFPSTHARHALTVDTSTCPLAWNKVPAPLRDSLLQLLAADPRPAYQDDPSRIYKLTFANFDVHFSVRSLTLIVLDVIVHGS